MFGSKIRSWMENHIVRSRKKGTKNKNGNSNVTTTATTTGNGHEGAYKKFDARGFTIYHGNGTTTTTASITTAVISCDSDGTTNGCGSVISSPGRRREVSPIQNHTQSRYGWQSPDQENLMSPKSENFLYAPQHHHHVKVNKEQICVEQNSSTMQQQQGELSSSSFSSLSWSTGSKEPSSSMQSNNNKYAKTLPTVEVMQNNSPPHSNNSQYHVECSSEVPDDDPNMVHYEEIQTLIRKPQNPFNNNNNGYFEQQRPKSDQFTYRMEPLAQVFDNQYKTDDVTTRYGRLLPSRIQAQHTNSSDSLNANHIRSSSAECIPSNNNNNHEIGTYRIHNHHVPRPPQNATAFASRNKLRAGRYAGAVMGASAAVAGGAQINSLSSPESAYSTGYSTDGTSPGAIYTPPEYYINMRTGTHYFPKSVNSLAIEAQRYKFGLNKIEEMSPQEPLPNRRADSHDSVHNKVPGFGIPDPEFCKNQIKLLEPQRPLQMTVGCHSPLSLRNPIVLPTLKGFESPSPRQRCRIRTNPWYSTTDTSSSGATTIGATSIQPFVSSTALSTASSSKSSSSSTKKMDLDAGSTSSSGIKSNSKSANDKSKHNEKPSYDSESSSSLTEVENVLRTHTPNTMRRKRVELPVAEVMSLYQQLGDGSVEHPPPLYPQEPIISDDDATLNEMMGKFDESYVYEKETDILSSDSDPTDCASDLDTGQDAGDECDTDELLDIDFIDTASIQEICDQKEQQRNLGSCVYYSRSPALKPKHQTEGRGSMRSRRNSRKAANSHEISNSAGQTATTAAAGSQRRRKRFMKTRKKSSESRGMTSPIHNSRESRSVGGTPVCLRRNMSAGSERVYKNSPLTNRASSLVFTDAHYRKNRFVTIAESEKALLEADLEADVKYRQLIHEAESILVSMKTNALSISRDTPVASPRRINPLANKRVEMLKLCEADTKRDQLRQQQQQQQQFKTFDVEHELMTASVNRRIDQLRCETNSAPNSPKLCRFSPRKTHLTNFINQNVPPEIPQRKPTSVPSDTKLYPPNSPQLQLNGRRLQSPTASPLNRRRFRSQSPKMVTKRSESDSDTEQHSNRMVNIVPHKQSRESLRKSSNENIVNRNYLPDIARIMLTDETDMRNHNVILPNSSSGAAAMKSFNSMGVSYCPQSEPLKRKVYKGSSSFERLKKSFDLESEIPKQALLSKINNLRRERLQSSTTKLSTSAKSSSHDINHSNSNLCTEPFNDDDASVASNLSSKKQLILSTLADLKRSLENQSVELNGLNEE